MKATVTKQHGSSQAKPGAGLVNAPRPGADRLFAQIATAAYYKAQARGFVPGRELDDWLEAEAELHAGEEH